MTKHHTSRSASADRPASEFRDELSQPSLLLLGAIAAGAQVEKVGSSWVFISTYPSVQRHMAIVPAYWDKLEEGGLVIVGEDGEIDLTRLGTAILQLEPAHPRQQPATPFEQTGDDT